MIFTIEPEFIKESFKLYPVAMGEIEGFYFSRSKGVRLNMRDMDKVYLKNAINKSKSECSQAYIRYNSSVSVDYNKEMINYFEYKIPQMESYFLKKEDEETF